MFRDARARKDGPETALLKRPLSLPTKECCSSCFWRWMIPSMTLASASHSAARAAMCQAVSFPSGLTFAVRIWNPSLISLKSSDGPTSSDVG